MKIVSNKGGTLWEQYTTRIDAVFVPFVDDSLKLLMLFDNNLWSPCMLALYSPHPRLFCHPLGV